jgi:C_GCAxxG_C_C family probable redox protein
MIEQLEQNAVRHFIEGKLSCSESVLLAMAEYWGINDPLIPRIATGFRGGLCGTQRLCGAVSGALMAIGLRLGRDSGEQNAQNCVDKGKAFLAFIEGEKGSLQCRDITGLDLSVPEQSKLFHDSVRGELCAALVARCCRWVAENVA